MFATTDLSLIIFLYADVEGIYVITSGVPDEPKVIYVIVLSVEQKQHHKNTIQHL